MSKCILFCCRNGKFCGMGLRGFCSNAVDFGRDRSLLPFHWRQTENNKCKSTWVFLSFLFVPTEMEPLLTILFYPPEQEYFLADRNISIWPVSFSLMASFMSAVTLLGVSMENYQYGTLFVVINISYGLATPIAAYLYLPVFFKLQATSAYEVNRLNRSVHK